jgi:hypothetical protein
MVTKLATCILLYSFVLLVDCVTRPWVYCLFTLFCSQIRSWKSTLLQLFAPCFFILLVTAVSYLPPALEDDPYPPIDSIKPLPKCYVRLADVISRQAFIYLCVCVYVRSVKISLFRTVEGLFQGSELAFPILSVHWGSPFVFVHLFPPPPPPTQFWH